MEQTDSEDPATECEICSQPKTSTQFFTNGDVCAHPFCKDCVASYIDVKVQDAGAGNVQCPAVDCAQSLDILSCRPIIPAELFERWTRLLCQAAIEESDGCYCPNNYCSELIINECGGLVEGSSDCPNCKENFCFQCRMAWEEGHRCENRSRRTSDDRQFERLAAMRKWTRCPVCHHYVELIQGCFFVTCRCGSSFCYYCGKKCESHLCNCRNGRIEARCVYYTTYCCFILLFLLVMTTLIAIIMYFGATKSKNDI